MFRNRAGSYGGTTSTPSVCEDVEGGKTDGNIRITAFSLEQGKEGEGTNGHAGDGSNGRAWTLDSEVASTLQRRQHGVSGCMNPAFIDDDPAAEKGEREEDEADDDDNTDGTKTEEKSWKPNGKTATSPSPDSSESSRSQNSKPSTSGGEELEMNGSVAGGQGQGQKNGSIVNHLNDSSTEAETRDEETAIDEEEADGGKDGGREEGKKEGTGVQPQAATSSGPRQLEVVLDRDPSPADPRTCVTVHRDKDDKEG